MVIRGQCWKEIVRGDGGKKVNNTDTVSSVVKAKVTRSDGTGDFDTSRGKTSH